MAQPLTDSILALTRYANEVTGQSDTNLSDAVRTLCDGYGGGGGYSLSEVSEYGNDCAVSGDIVFDGSYIRPYLFANNKSITSFVGNNVTDAMADTMQVGGSNTSTYTFYLCTALRYVSLPKLIDFYHTDYVFSDCTSLEEVDLDYMNLKRVATGMFYKCTNLRKSVYVMQNLERKIYSNFLAYNPYISILDVRFVGVANERSLADRSFESCSSLSTIIMRNTENVNALVSVGAINRSTPFSSNGTGGTLYVPQSMISAYQANTNWATVLGYANNQILPIEGSQYENYYADGTPIT